MILDTLANAAPYRCLSPLLAAGLDYLARTDFTKLDPGRYDIDADRVYALVQRYTTKPRAQAKWEAHRKYLDIQYIVTGRESIGHALLTPATQVTTPYDAQKDVAFFAAEGHWLTLGPGQLAIFAPHDIHAPTLAPGIPGEPGEVLKVVVKVAVSGAGGL